MSVIDDILNGRSIGVTKAFRELTGGRDLADCMRLLDLQPGVDLLRTVTLDDARRIAESILWRDLAYRGEIMPRHRATSMAAELLANFEDENAQSFTNAWFEGDNLKSWNPLTTATFDAGVIVLGPKHIAGLWVQDED